MKKNIFIITVLLCFPYKLFSQENIKEAHKKNEIGILIGMDYTLIKDLNYSPLNYSGLGIGGSLFYQRLIKEKHFFSSRISYSSTQIQSEGLKYTKSLNNLIDLEFMYLMRLKRFDNSLTVYTGGAVSSNLDLINFEDSEAVSYFNFHGVSLAWRVDYNIANKHQVLSTLKIPLLGIVARPPYTGWDNEGFELSGLVLAYKGPITSLNNFFGISWTNLYKYNISEKYDFTFQFHFQYNKTHLTELAINAHTQVSIGTNIKF